MSGIFETIRNLYFSIDHLLLFTYCLKLIGRRGRGERAFSLVTLFLVVTVDVHLIKVTDVKY